MEEIRLIEEEIKGCVKCPLHKFRTNAVPGEGTCRFGLMFVGEAPGFNEDRQGRPFVGAAGKLLTELIEDILGLKRGDVYITNVVKCRPPKNRDPLPEEIEACTPYLERQVSLLRPRIIATLGRHSTLHFLSKAGIGARGIMAVRGKPHKLRYAGIPLTIFPTLHPAAALYNPKNREVIEEDFRRLRGMLDGLLSYM